MDSGVRGMVVMAVAFFGLFVLSELLYHLLRVNAERTRKFVHIGTGLLALLFPVVLQNHWQVLLLCGIFAVLLLVSLLTGLLPSVNAIRRQSYGSLGYPVAVYGSFLAYEYHSHQYLYYYLPVLVLALCDPLAAYVGRKWRYRPFRIGTGIKTIGGSLAFFFAAILVTASVQVYLGEYSTTKQFLRIAVWVAALSTLAEALSSKGLDNVTIPAAVLLALVIGGR